MTVHVLLAALGSAGWLHLRRSHGRHQLDRDLDQACGYEAGGDYSFATSLRELPAPGKTIYTDRNVWLPRTPQAGDLGPFTPGPVVWTPARSPVTAAELDEWKERFLAAQGGPPKVLPPYEYDITEEEFEAAKRDVIERLGAIPPSLQRVIDRGGRFARTVATEPGPVQVPHAAPDTPRTCWCGQPEGHVAASLSRGDLDDAFSTSQFPAVTA